MKMSKFMNNFSGVKLKLPVLAGLAAVCLTACGAVGNFVKLPEANVNLPAANAVAANTPERVKTVSGSPSPNEFSAVKEAGEILDITWQQMPNMFQKIGEQVAYRCPWSGRLSESGDYQLVVYLDGNAKTNSIYTLKLTLE